MKKNQEPTKKYPVPSLRVVVNNGRNPVQNIRRTEKKESVKEKKSPRDIPLFYQHQIKPREYDFF